MLDILLFVFLVTNPTGEGPSRLLPRYGHYATACLLAAAGLLSTVWSNNYIDNRHRLRNLPYGSSLTHGFGLMYLLLQHAFMHCVHVVRCSPTLPC